MVIANNKTRIGLSQLATFVFVAYAFLADPIQADILVGQTAPGGRTMPVALGMAFAFNEVNALGGVNSQNVTLISLDDASNTTRAYQNVKQLVDDYNVSLLAGVVSSPIFTKILPFVAERHVPLVGSITGIPLTRDPFVEEVINVRASYFDEIIYHLACLSQYAWVRQVGIFYQDDAFGQAGYALAVSGLQYVGLNLVAVGKHTAGLLDVESAVETLLSATPKLQAVIMLTLQAANVKFIQMFKQDRRSHPACVFTLMSVGSSSTFAPQLTQKYWGNVFMFLTVPVPGDSRYAIAKDFATTYQQAGFDPDTMALEGYLTGRFIIQVLKNLRTTGNITRKMFLDEVYNTHLFALDGLHLGLYSRNYDGCSEVLCSCNSGLRSVFVTVPDPSTGQSIPGLPVMTYPITQCSNTLSALKSPLLFGQLIPRDDPIWTAFAFQIGRGISAAFDDANGDGALGGRQFILVQKEYSDYNVTANISSRAAQISQVFTTTYVSSLSSAIANLAEDHPLLAFIGSVVGTSEYAMFPLPTVGTFDTQWDIQDHEFYAPDMRIQPNTAIEIMALAQYAAQEPHRPLHLRAPETKMGHQMLSNMVKAVHNTQQRPTSVKTYSSAADALDGVGEGWLLGVGEDSVIEEWFMALQDRQGVDLLTVSASALHLLASPTYASLKQTKRLHFPSFNTAIWNTTVQGEAETEAYRYGYLAGHAVAQVMTHSEFAHLSYNTPKELQAAWYAARLITYKTILLGSYSSENCTDDDDTQCECNEGVRRVAIRSGANDDVEHVYTSLTCYVVYQPLQDNTAIAGAIGGSVGGLCLIIGAMLLFIVSNRRSHRTAPKDAKQPFCILFTDIQSSTNLWATIPEEMTSALNIHHNIIRKLIAKHQCYEVKTIGDSFMCACKTPAQAMHFALALQQQFHEYDWGTMAIDRVYVGQQTAKTQGECWNGLRVRVGIHYGLGEIHLDPVSKGYDYYGTVVNTAARIEAVCHGGQIGVSAAVYEHLGADFPDVVWTDLGVHSLRGLSEPLKIYQALPTSPLSSRQFPPLRTEQEPAHDIDVRQETDDRFSMVSGSSKKNSVFPASSTVGNIENWQWAEVHPLVQKGDTTAEELKSHYQILFAGLNTLLATQKQKFREEIIAGLCSRLHIHNYGAQGIGLHRTIRGLVQRILPSTITSVEPGHVNRHKHTGPVKLRLDSVASNARRSEHLYAEEAVEPWSSAHS